MIVDTQLSMLNILMMYVYDGNNFIMYAHFTDETYKNLIILIISIHLVGKSKESCMILEDS